MEGHLKRALARFHHHVLVYNPARHLKWGMIHAALILTFADLVAAVWPAFDRVWTHHAQIVIGMASVSATIVEYIGEHKEVALLQRFRRRQAFALKTAGLTAETPEVVNDVGMTDDT